MPTPILATLYIPPPRVAPRPHLAAQLDEELHRKRTLISAPAGLALARGDVPGAVTHAGQAHDLAGEDNHLTRGAVAGFLGLATWTSAQHTPLALTASPV